MNFQDLPDNVILLIFSYIGPFDVTLAGRTCRNWRKVSFDEFLWKDLFHSYFKIKRYYTLPANAYSWYSEFVRLTYYRPRCEASCLKDHKDQVLHVSFSHNGEYFASCSKDGFVKVWDATVFPTVLKYSSDLKGYSWKYTQYSQFNSDDSLLLVSGVHFGTHSTSGEIAVFNMLDDFKLQCRVINRPYDIFGIWYNNEYLISGNLHWLGHLTSCSALWINKAWQESDSENEAVVMQTLKFLNLNGSSLRTIMIADCLDQNDHFQKPNTEQDVSDSKPYHSTSERERHANAFYPTSRDKGHSIFHPKFHTSPTPTTSTLRQNENDVPSSSALPPDTAIYVPPKSIHPATSSPPHPSTVVRFPEDGLGRLLRDSNDVIEERDKYLVFTTGSRTYTPHQIGFKRIKPIRMTHTLEATNYYRGARLFANDEAQNFPEQVQFDDIDHLIDVNGHIIGMSFSPDQRYLYVNTRAWPQDAVISNPLNPPPIAQEIEIRVIDMLTLKEVEGLVFRAHKAFTPNEECFFIFLDVSNDYVASGAEDRHAYIWDRHYGILLDKFPHSDVVNSVAFNPKNPEMMVSSSDDGSIKVWVSKRIKEQIAANRQGINLMDTPPPTTTFEGLDDLVTSYEPDTF